MSHNIVTSLGQTLTLTLQTGLPQGSILNPPPFPHPGQQPGATSLTVMRGATHYTRVTQTKEP